MRTQETKRKIDSAWGIGVRYHFPGGNRCQVPFPRTNVLRSRAAHMGVDDLQRRGGVQYVVAQAKTPLRDRSVFLFFVLLSNHGSKSIPIRT